MLIISSPQNAAEHTWLHELWRAEWGGDTMVSRGHVYRLADVSALLARRDGELVGAATYRFDHTGGCELLSINATQSGGGVGSELLTAVERAAAEAGSVRVWLITSNDNLDALRFYQRRGYRLSAIYPGAIDAARQQKPTIPLVGNHEIEIHDELELLKALAPAADLPAWERGLLHHVEINVSNLEQSAEFWGWLLTHLGYQPYQTWPQGRSWQKGTAYVVLVQTEPDFQSPPYHRKRTGLNHLAFHAGSQADVDELTKLLEERGVRVLYRDRHPYAGGAGHYAVFFEDPDGIKVEVVAPQAR